MKYTNELRDKLKNIKYGLNVWDVLGLIANEVEKNDAYELNIIKENWEIFSNLLDNNPEKIEKVWLNFSIYLLNYLREFGDIHPICSTTKNSLDLLKSGKYPDLKYIYQYSKEELRRLFDITENVKNCAPIERRINKILQLSCAVSAVILDVTIIDEEFCSYSEAHRAVENVKECIPYLFNNNKIFIQEIEENKNLYKDVYICLLEKINEILKNC